MLSQIVIGPVGNSFEFLPVAASEWEPVFDIDTGLGVMSKFVGIVVPQAEILFFDTEINVPVEAIFFPVFVPLFVGARFAEEFKFCLFEFACAEDKGFGRYCVANALAVLCYS